MNHKLYSIRLQVTCLTFIPMLVMTVCLEAFFLHVRFQDMDSVLQERGKLIASQLASGSEYGVFSNNLAFLRNISGNVLQQADVRGVAILNAAFEPVILSGELSGSYADSKLATSDFISRLKAIREVSNPLNLHATVRQHREGAWIYQPIVPSQVILSELEIQPVARQVGAVIVEMSNAQIQRTRTRILGYTVLITLLFFSSAFYLVQLAGRRLTDPIGKLSEAVEMIGTGDLETRVSVDSRICELRTLEHGINEMAEQLLHERAFLQQRVDEATAALRMGRDVAERASHDKSRFLAAASHDMRQPIHALGLYLSELRRKISGAAEQHLVAQIEHSVEAVSTLINALLDISKLDAGVIVPQMQLCNLSALLARVATDYRMQAELKGIRLLVRPFRGFAISDPVLLERILMNLLSNAVRYTRPNGVVLIAGRKRGTRWRIEVRDNGIGIAAADQVKIFREFFQLPHSHAQQGSGLGLSIVDRTVRLLGHTLALRSAPERGSVFALELEAADGVAATPKAVGDEAGLAGKRVLVAFGDVPQRDAVMAMLLAWGCVAVAQNQQSEPTAGWDLIISDEWLTAGGNAVRGHPLPHILISNHTCQAAVEEGIAVLPKPVKPAKLRSLMQYLLNR